MKRNLKDFSSKRRMYGRMFILPWEIGFVLFFLQPLVQSLTFVFSEVDTVGACSDHNDDHEYIDSPFCVPAELAFERREQFVVEFMTFHEWDSGLCAFDHIVLDLIICERVVSSPTLVALHLR